jgi:hypothetical protein
MMDVSINYPWGSTWLQTDTGRTSHQSPGWDFGVAPTEWGPPDWRAHLAQDLVVFHKLGIRAVRMAILFNGLTYGTGPDIPQPAGATDALPDWWDFEPVPLSDRFVNDFRDLVRTFINYSDHHGPLVKLMPVLIGFEFAADPRGPMPPNPPLPNWTDFTDRRGVAYRSGRRSAALRSTPSRQGARQTRQQAFLSYVVDGLFADFGDGGMFAHHRNAIHSVDLCGEPEALTIDPTQHADPQWQSKIELTDTISYLNDGIDRIRGHQLTPTVGFRYLRTLSDPSWTAHLAAHQPQFHYYDNSRLPVVHGDAPAIIGEVATTAASPFDERITPTRSGTDATIPLGLRLEWFERLGYREVFLWSAGRAEPDNRHSWGPTEADAVADFTQGRRPYAQQINEAVTRFAPA